MKRMVKQGKAVGISCLHSLEPVLPVALGLSFPPLVQHKAAFNLGTVYTATLL